MAKEQLSRGYFDGQAKHSQAQNLFFQTFLFIS